MFPSLVRHGLVYFGARAIPGLVNLVAVAVFTRLLEPGEYGRYAVLMSLVALANSVFFQWLRLGLLRFLPAYSNRRQELLSTTMAGYGIATLIMLAFAVPFTLLTSYGRDWEGIALSIFVVVSMAFFEMTLEVLRSDLAPRVYSLVTITKAGLAFSVGALLVYDGFGAGGLLVGQAIGMLVPSLLSSRHSWGQISANLVERGILRNIVQYGIPLTANAALSYVVSSSDRLLLGMMLGDESAGLYSVSYDLTQQSIGMLMMVINLAAYPIAVRAFERDGKQRAAECLRDSAAALTAIGVPAAVGLSVVAADVASVLLGQAFREAAIWLIPWISLGALLAGLKAYFLDICFQLTCNTNSQVIIMLATASLNLGLNFLLIPSMGYMGAAVATVLAYGVGLVLSWSRGRRLMPVQYPWKTGLQVLAAATVMGLSLTVLPQTHNVFGLAAKVSFGVLVYVMGLFVLNAMGCRSNTLRLLKNRLSSSD